MRGEGYHHLYDENYSDGSGIGQFESRYATTKNIEEIKDNQRRNRDTQLQTRVPGRIPERRKTIIRIKSSTRKSLG